MIAQHIVSNTEIQKYNVYGFGHSKERYSTEITKFYFDINSDLLKHYTEIIKPDLIIHLASISSSQTAFEYPLDAIQTNGVLTAKLCDIIYSNKWNTKLFNASSSEIYKGHIDYLITENDTNKYHNHPYSIAKTIGHSIVDFYREQLGQSFSNGIIFTTESKLKKPIFLLNKIADHIHKWKNNTDILPLTVGNLDSYRNILHASDVASAIFTILSQESANNYLICNNESHKVKDLVFSLLKSGGIDIEERENIIYDKVKNRPILIIDSDKYLGFDSTPTNIRGESVNLKRLGWLPKVSIDEILVEILER
jgi:GDPmannose 4,6-dehydratase